ncbi:MAG TPA: antibiotic biosynthesis monooxygenase family protein [Pseudonocardiaceae bacterium]|jgi:heme-degrading monooxygenase HmoA|nr:antibiotic biosynthesis monooxygenase family protein [Pseudonocardiaceae bacterium]
MADPVTLINVFEVPADQVDAIVADWRRRAELMSTMPGFRDYQLHRAISADARFQLINVAHWDSAEAWQAATSNPEFQAQISVVANNPNVTATPALYQVAEVASAANA